MRGSWNAKIEVILNESIKNDIFLIVKKLYTYIVVFIAGFFIVNDSYAQKTNIEDLNKQVVQLYGVIRTESNIPLPQASVFVEGTKRGTLTNDRGIYSIVVKKGDKIRFSYIGFKDAIVSIPADLISQTYNVDFKMQEDTTLLPTTFIKSLPSAAKFERDFLAMSVDLTSYDIAQYNVRKEVLQAMMNTVPRDGVETVSRQVLNATPGRAIVNGQSQPVNMFRPASWKSMVKDWKEGGSPQN